MPNLPTVQSVVEKRLEEYAIEPNTNLGQHFLIDGPILRQIGDQAKTEATVIEIGPGIGQLTEILARSAKQVVAVEIDRHFTLALKHIQKKYPNLQLVFGDALKIDLDQMVNLAQKKGRPVQIIANLPYHITEPFLSRTTQLKISDMTLLVGRRFARSALAPQAVDPNYSYLSLLTQAFFTVEHLIEVPKTAFLPEPNTPSDVLKFTPRSTLTEPLNQYQFVMQQFVLTQTKGAKVKNVLKESLISFGTHHTPTEDLASIVTQKQARLTIGYLAIPEGILTKPFSQLNNLEIRTLAQQLQTLKDSSPLQNSLPKLN